MSDEDDLLDKFIAARPFEFDLTGLMSQDLLKLDEERPPPTLFKYFPGNRPQFFVTPMLRFTQRVGLNDPFELSNRWRGAAPDHLKVAISNHIKQAIYDLSKNKGFALKVFAQQEAKRGIHFNSDEIAQMAGHVLSPEGQFRFQAAIADTLSKVDAFVDLFFSEFEIAISHGFDELTNDWGILSLTDDPTSPAMWALYADNGKGFMVEFETDHQFFKAPNGRNLLWHVNYKDANTELLFENPAALFLTKHSQFSFEKEWRFIKQLRNCDEIIERGTEKMYMWHLVPGIIKSVTFGYNFNKNEFPTYAAWLKVMFDASIQMRVAYANRRTGKIELHNLDEFIEENQKQA